MVLFVVGVLKHLLIKNVAVKQKQKQNNENELFVEIMV